MLFFFRILVIDEISGEIRIVGNASQGRLPLQVTARDLNGLIAHAPVEVIIPTCPLDCPAVLRAQVREDSPRGVGITFVTVSVPQKYLHFHLSIFLLYLFISYHALFSLNDEFLSFKKTKKNQKKPKK
jgi:hypothetical protein